MDKLSLVSRFLLGESGEPVYPNFPPSDIPPGAPDWMNEWVSEGKCLECGGTGKLNLPGGFNITCVACKGYCNRENYINGDWNSK